MMNWNVQYLLHQLLAQSAGLDGKLQLRIHGGDVNIDLWKTRVNRGSNAGLQQPGGGGNP